MDVIDIMPKAKADKNSIEINAAINDSLLSEAFLLKIFIKIFDIDTTRMNNIIFIVFFCRDILVSDGN